MFCDAGFRTVRKCLSPDYGSGNSDGDSHGDDDRNGGGDGDDGDDGDSDDGDDNGHKNNDDNDNDDDNDDTILTNTFDLSENTFTF